MQRYFTVSFVETIAELECNGHTPEPVCLVSTVVCDFLLLHLCKSLRFRDETIGDKASGAMNSRGNGGCADCHKPLVTATWPDLHKFAIECISALLFCLLSIVGTGFCASPWCVSLYWRFLYRELERLAAAQRKQAAEGACGPA